MALAFHKTAEFYESLAGGQARIEREGPLLLKLLSSVPESKRVVDLACGTGVHAQFLSQNAADVTAMDISGDMVRCARDARGADKIDFRVCDMRELEGGPWDMALCLGNSMSLLASLEEVSLVLERVYDRLAPSGLFLVQILNYASDNAQKPRHRVEKKIVGEKEVMAVKSLVPVGDRTLLSLAFFKLDETEDNSVSETAVLLNITREQIEASAIDAGFTVENIYGGYDSSIFSEAMSSDVVCVLRKLSD